MWCWQQREWGVIYTKGDDADRHLRELAERAAEGISEATGTTVELAEPAAQPQQPRSGLRGARLRYSCLFIWLKGRPEPPASGLMHMGEGQLRGQERVVVRSVAPLSFAWTWKLFSVVAGQQPVTIATKCSATSIATSMAT